MSKYPAEVLGIPSWDNRAIQQSAENDRLCPFMGRPCTKTNGICSVHNQSQTIAICPSRFLEQSKVFQKIAHDHFGDLRDLLVFKEVYTGDSALGTFDYVIAQHHPLSSEIADFAVVEFQTIDTTMTGELNRALVDLQSNRNVTEGNYRFRLNWANVWKRCFIQILNKGRVLEQWGHRSYWIAQEAAYQYFVDAYGLASSMQSNGAGATVFDIYDLVATDSGVTLQAVRTESTSVEALLIAFGRNPNVPSKDRFIKRLVDSTRRSVSVRLTLEE